MKLSYGSRVRNPILILLALTLGGAVRGQEPPMPAYPSTFHVEALEGLEPHADHPGGRADTEGRLRLKALSGIARMKIAFPPGEKPTAIEIRIDGWTDALEGLDLDRPDGEHRSLIETGEAAILLKEGSLTVTLRPAALEWLATGTQIQFIDRYR